MKKFLSGIIILCIISCNQTINHQIEFSALGENDFNFNADTTFSIPHSKTWEDRKRIHDSCMGGSYAANAVFMKNRDTFLIGSIVDMKTMRVVKRPPFFFDSLNFIPSAIVFATKPCYQKYPMDILLDSFLNKSFNIKIDSSSEMLNEELTEAIRNSDKREIETGSWVNAEITDVLGKVLDTTTNVSLLDYKKLLLKPENMILVRVSAITDITFYFHTTKPLSTNLINKLSANPFAMQQETMKSQLFYIDQNNFKIKFNGFFQVAGQFMKAQNKS